MAGRPKNPLQTATLTVSTNTLVTGHLTALVQTGLYGKTEAEAAERLIAGAIRELIRNGELKSHYGQTPKPRAR